MNTYSLLSWMVRYHTSRKTRNRFNLENLQTRYDRAEDPEKAAKENDTASNADDRRTNNLVEAKLDR